MCAWLLWYIADGPSLDSHRPVKQSYAILLKCYVCRYIYLELARYLNCVFTLLRLMDYCGFYADLCFSYSSHRLECLYPNISYNLSRQVANILTFCPSELIAIVYGLIWTSTATLYRGALAGTHNEVAAFLFPGLNFFEIDSNWQGYADSLVSHAL